MRNPINVIDIACALHWFETCENLKLDSDITYEIIQKEYETAIRRFREDPIFWKKVQVITELLDGRIKHD